MTKSIQQAVKSRLTGSIPSEQHAGLSTPIQYLKGVGPKRAAMLAKLGITTVGDLLFLVPRRYVDRSRTAPIARLKVGDEVTVFGRVLAVGNRCTRTFKRLVSCLVGDESGTIEAVWFNRPDLTERFRPGQELMLSGKVTAYRTKQFVNPRFEILERGGEFSATNAIIPVYPLTEGLSIWALRRMLRTALNGYLPAVQETMPDEILGRYGFPSMQEALETIHFPQDVESAERARSRLVYEELFYLELLLALRKRQQVTQREGFRLPETGVLTQQFRQLLPFKLTRGQEAVLREILADMASPRCMNRLLQGDVGSGKTVVAIYAMLVACENQAQAAMMAPTELLASQHYKRWAAVLENLGVRAGLLTGSKRAKERQKLLEELEDGRLQMVFGTHALIEENVRFHRLGLVVVDEQHRFGVMQRAALMNKGRNPDFLVMTATPIPRTLTLTVYGDLDTSILAEKPAGRVPVVTRIVTEEKRAKVYEYFEKRFAQGEQAFIICPLIEESEKLDLASALRTYEEVKTAFPNRRVGLVHGKMRSEEREEQMELLREKKLDILVSTTVIEVGVDVPDATMMLIEHPERFGLAQLHQLRGRIGRSNRRGVCVLMVRPEATEAMERLEYFASTTDGFALAEKDARWRGPGQLLGTRQHGLPDLRIADPFTDRAMLVRARRDAFRLIETDPFLCDPRHAMVRRTLAARYAGREELLRVG